MLEQMKSVVAAGAVAVALAVSGPAAGQVPESKDPIKLTLHDCPRGRSPGRSKQDPLPWAN